MNWIKFQNIGVTELDKYEYNLKLEEIDKQVAQGNYQEAANLADTIDWRRVRNIRTLCLISEIYEATGRLEDSKALLERAYKRSPVGRTVLYRLIEVTTKLGQYDEAIEYYSDYVQIAMHDNNRYILKYNIYKGRGSQPEELIAILEEYLGQEYTERWAYELASLYQQTGQMQKCIAACDDLVLWFHSGKYVTKALELKKRYAALTPKQQQIYEEGMQAAQTDPLEEESQEETVIQDMESARGEVLAETIMAQTEKEISDQVAAHKAELDRSSGGTAEDAAAESDTSANAAADSDTNPLPDQEKEEEPANRQVELARSMRQIISGVVKREDEHEDDIPASVEQKARGSLKIEIPEPSDSEQIAGQISIDDILLSMSDQGRKVADEVISAAEQKEAEETEDAKPRPETDEEEAKAPAQTVAEVVADELTEDQREALQYTSHPEKLLKNTRSLPTYTQDGDLGKTRKIVNTKEELKEAAEQELLAEKTIRIPTEQISRRLEESGQEGIGAPSGAEAQELTRGYPAEDGEPYDTAAEHDTAAEYDAAAEHDAAADGEEGDGGSYDEETKESLVIPQHLRGLFNGFVQVEGLEEQIANAILQAESKGDDRTSRSGNILIFGAHGSGKTTLAMDVAKAIAQDRGSQTAKIAKIYAADLNRKDIAATIAKIAGGTLIIEEAGDLEQGTVEQLTTAMEFRTNGLIMILEDEQQYIHELLMQHPRFTMKFTAQIYIPAYNVDELAVFGQIHARAQDYVIGDEAYEALKQKIAQAQSEGAVTITDVTEMVDKAISRSNRFFRKMSMGKKRYDENDYVVLFPKDIGR